MVSTRYLVDDKNRKKAVVISLREYKHLIARIEELEDALDLDNMLRSKSSFRDYTEISKELKEQGRL